MYPTVHIALLGWIPFILVLFAFVPARKAVVFVFITGTLFLPAYSYSFEGFPSFGPLLASCLGILLATAIYDTQRFLAFKPQLFDLPVLVLAFVPFMTSISNGLGPYDGLSATFRATVSWLLPYFVGRLYFSDVRGLTDLAKGFFWGGLVYVPLCLWEVRMSPQLSNQIYGLPVGSFAQTMRFGGFRPVVFSGGQGLSLSLFMCFSFIAAYWLWRTKTYKHILNVPMVFIVGIMLVTTLFTRSIGPIATMVAGLIVLELARHFKSPLPIIMLLMAPITFIFVRATGLWDAVVMVDWAERLFGPERARSLETRVINDNILSEWARNQLFLGWGGWGRNRPPDISTITDSRWVIIFGVNGLVGLVSWVLVMSLPIFLMTYRISAKYWAHPMLAMAPAIAVMIILNFIDNTQNVTTVPLLLVMIGGLMGLSKVRVVRRVAGPEEEMMEEDAERAQGPVTGKARRRRRVAGGGSPGPGARRRPGSVALD